MVNFFVEKAARIHGNKYDYSNSVYVSAKSKIDINCPLHGIFKSTPDNHLRLKSGCPKCNGGVRLDLNTFLKKATQIHENKYDYSNVVHYNNTRQKIIIICKIHGKFEQKISDHLSGCGCRLCGKEKMIAKKSDNLESFIKKARKIHRNKYDYSLVDYYRSNTKIKIVCPIHGTFEQTPNSHLNGSGCSSCKESVGAKLIRTFLEENKINYSTEKRFDKCRSIRPLPFDFYLPDYNICIEYDGEQHFNKTNFFYREQIKFRDNIKNTFCDGLNGRPQLIRIKFDQYLEIPAILSKFRRRTN